MLNLLHSRSLPVFTAVLALSTATALAEDASGRSGWDAALEQLKVMHTAPGLEVKLFASEPKVRNPTNMDVDHRGRVWITEGVNYRVWQKWSKIRPAGDRIVILEDTDGDGIADKETTFYQGPEINAALGICVLGNKVIVSCAPKVFVFTDADGDDKADGPPQVLFNGIGGVDHDHAIHAFVFGPDGKLYFNYGNEGKRIGDPAGKALTDLDGNEVAANGRPYRQGMAFRCNPDGSGIETLAWNFRNPYEVAVDSFGRLWQSDNDDDGNEGVRINFLTEFGNYGYTDEMTGAGWGDAWNKAARKGVPAKEKVQYEWHQHDPGVVPDLLHTGGGSPTGICIYEGNLLPELFRNQIVHCDAGPRVVRAYPVVPSGAGYAATAENILTSDDNWFRPCDVCVAPDGALYVADWNDAGVGGHYMADQKYEIMTGRVYRVAPTGNKPAIPHPDFKSAAGCVEALQSPNQETRYLAWTELNRMQGKAKKDLERLSKNSNPRMRARALPLLARIEGNADSAIEAGLRDADPEVRCAALRTARSLKLDLTVYLKASVKDSSPSVRRECAVALRHNKSSGAPDLWAELASQFDGQDRWYLEALGIGADGQWDSFLDAWLNKVGDGWNGPAGREIVWRSRAHKTPGLLVKIITDKDTPEKSREHFFRSLDFVAGPEKDAALLQLLTSSNMK